METNTTEETELQSLMHMVRSQLPDISQAANLIEQVEVGSAVLLEVLEQHGMVNGVDKEMRGLARKLEGHPAHNISLVRVLSMLTAVLLSLLQDKTRDADKTPLSRQNDEDPGRQVHSGSPSAKYTSSKQTSATMTSPKHARTSPTMTELAANPLGTYSTQKPGAARISGGNMGKLMSNSDSPRSGLETSPVRSTVSPAQALLPFSRSISAAGIPSSRPSATPANSDTALGPPATSAALSTFPRTRTSHAHDLPYYHGASVDDATPLYRTLPYRQSEPPSTQGSNVITEPMAEPTIESASDRGSMGAFTLGTGMWGTMYCESQGERRQAFDLLARTGIISNKELAENSSSIPLDHVDDCLHIAREMLNKYSIDVWVANAGEANQHFQGRLATLYAERYSTPTDDKPPTT